MHTAYQIAATEEQKSYETCVRSIEVKGYVAPSQDK